MAHLDDDSRPDQIEWPRLSLKEATPVEFGDRTDCKNWRRARARPRNPGIHGRTTGFPARAAAFASAAAGPARAPGTEPARARKIEEVLRNWKTAVAAAARR